MYTRYSEYSIRFEYILQNELYTLQGIQNTQYALNIFYRMSFTPYVALLQHDEDTYNTLLKSSLFKEEQLISSIYEGAVNSIT